VPAPAESTLDRARGILDAMEGDASLVSERIAGWWSNYLKYHRDRYLDSLALVGPVTGRVLEVGSVPCQFTLLLKRLGYDVAGTDLAPERVSRFLERHDLRVDKVDIETERFPFEDGSFDTVLFFEVLEHLRINPLHTLRELARVLKPGGRLILTTPNITPAQRVSFLLDRPYQGDLVEEFKKLETVGHMGHFRLYSPVDIRRLLGAVGLHIDSLGYRGELAVPNWQSKLLLLLSPRKEIFRAYIVVQAHR
jgi:SAM-dependent methyltransferase